MPDFEQALRSLADDRSLTVEFVEWGEDEAAVNAAGERSPFRYRLMVESDEHRGVAGIAWCTPEEREQSIRWVIDALMAWPDITTAEPPPTSYPFLGAHAVGKREAIERQRDRDGQRLYILLALLDRRDGTPLADLVHAAREGWERSHPDMAEEDAWAEFDRLWGSYTDRQRLELARPEMPDV